MKIHIKKFIFVLILFYIPSISNAVDGNYLFSLESMTQANIDVISTPLAGMMVFNSTDNKVYDYNGTEWVTLTSLASVITKTANYTLTSSDNGAVFRFNSTSDMNLTIPSGLAVGYNVSVYQIDTGKVTVIASGVTLKNRLSRFKTAGLDAGIGIVSTIINVFHLTGDLKK